MSIVHGEMGFALEIFFVIFVIAISIFDTNVWGSTCVFLSVYYGWVVAVQVHSVVNAHR